MSRRPLSPVPLPEVKRGRSGGPPLRRLMIALSVAGALGLTAERSHANGRFPTANQLLVDPTDARHLVVGATFGLLESRDAGQSFSWSCERVLGLADQEDPMIVMSDVGTVALATFGGLILTQDSCNYAHVPELAGELIPDITRSPGVRGQLYGFRTVGLAGGRFDSELLRSDDGGATWERLAPKLPEELLPLTLEVAASDPQRLYLTARRGRDAGYDSVLLRSTDAGESFEELPIAGTEGQRLAFIAAVDPTNSDRVYLRVDDVGTAIIVTDDAGDSFRTLFTGTGRLLGFSLSPDGSTLAFGGPSDGIWSGFTEDEAFEQRSDIGPSCLTFTENALYACADWAVHGFSVGRSRDGGATFETLLTFPELCGATACDTETQVGRECDAPWNQTGVQLGATCGVDDVSSGGRAGAPSNRAGRASSDDASESGGCAVGSPGSAPGTSSSNALGWLALVFGCRRAFARRAQVPRSTRPSA